MLWWQITLLMLGALVAGFAVVIAISYGLKRYRSERARANAGDRGPTNPSARGKTKVPSRSPTPLLSRRSIIALSVGMVVGGMLALAYWISMPWVNDTLAKVRSGSVSPGGTTEQAGPHESRVSVVITNPGLQTVTVKDLQRKGEYYAAKANTLPFFEYLSQRLAEEKHPFSVEQLYEITTIRYDYKSDVPALEIKVIGGSSHEAETLASLVPEVFQEYLVADEQRHRQEEYQHTLDDLSVKRTRLLEAKKELADIELKRTNALVNNPDYLALESTTKALLAELDNRAAGLASAIANSDNGQAYADNQSALNRVAASLAKSQRDLAIMKATTDTLRLTQDIDYQLAVGRVNNLDAELNRLTDNAVSLSDSAVSEAEVRNYLSVANPSPPVALPPERMRMRNALMVGAVIGLLVGWLLLNFRWVKKVLTSGTGSQDEETGGQITAASKQG